MTYVWCQASKQTSSAKILSVQVPKPKKRVQLKNPPWLVESSRQKTMWPFPAIQHWSVDTIQSILHDRYHQLSLLSIIYLVGGWGTPLKNMTSSIGMMNFPIYGKIKNVPNHQPFIIWVICQWLSHHIRTEFSWVPLRVKRPGARVTCTVAVRAKFSSPWEFERDDYRIEITVG